MTRALLEQRVLRDVDVVARAGLDLETFWDEAMASISRAVPHSAACVALVDPSTLLLTGTLKFGELLGVDGHDHEWGLREYGDPEPTAFRELAHRAIPAVGMRLEDSRSARLNDFMRPYYGFSDELRVVMRDQGQVWGALAMFRSGDQRPFSADEVALLAALSQTFTIGLRLGLLSRLGRAPLLAPCGPAVLIVDAQNHIVSVSSGAEQRLAELKVAEHQAESTGIIAALVGAARRFSRGDEARAPRTRVRTRTGMWLTLHASPMSTPDGVSRGDVVITIDEARPPEIVPLVVAAFDLTDRERAVTERVLQGHDTKEIAASLHLSAYTVQDNLKAVFEKASVHSRRELIARVYFDQYVPRMGTEIGPSGWFAASTA
ncbi:LuxR C-terminal-related transcriptional regulator [Propionibacteriaceae bacterium G57]|uniref:LuxR C-terminal-related transcriptional regulator n=1 Tax=Aestuariimicrobium sp. G57 TaxID=3418485 RepID=UPI003DA6F284